MALQPSIPEQRTTRRQLGAAILFYSAVTLAFHITVLGSLTSAVIGEIWDNQLFIWDSWWFRQSLFQGRSPFVTQMVLAPEGTPLILHSLKHTLSTTMALLDLFLPIELAYNLIVLAAFPLAGVGAYLLCRRFVGDHASSLAGGLFFMLCPFLVSKSVAGWVHLLYVGCLPFFFLALLRATDPAPPRGASWVLALVSLVALFTSEMLTVFAANVTLITLLWRLWESDERMETARRLFRALLPSALVCAPYLLLAGYYITAYDLPADVESRLSFIPEPISYLLPLNVTSIYSGLLLGDPWNSIPPTSLLGSYPELARAGLACYLGLLVGPLAIYGIIKHRRDPNGRLFLALFLIFLVLSLGPLLLFNREIVRIFGWPVRLPFVAWKRIPVLGEIDASGKYLVISYMALSVGFAAAVFAVRSRLAAGRANAWVMAAAALVCVDYGFRTWTSPLPQVPPLEGRPGAVMDPRLKSGYSMYYQTKHGRPLVGGYLSRTPERPLQLYRKVPGMRCLFFGEREADCSREVIMEGLRRLNVTDVLLAPLDWRNNLMATLGFTPLYSDQFTKVWSVPSPGAQTGSSPP